MDTKKDDVRKIDISEEEIEEQRHIIAEIWNVPYDLLWKSKGEQK